MVRTKSVLIIGGSGTVGTHLALRLRENYKVFATYLRRQLEIPGVTSIPADIQGRNWVKRVIYTANPDVVIYAAGSSRVDLAESDPKETEKVHTSGPATASNIADILQPKFIYLSSSHVFDGMKGNYRESDSVMPSTVLGKAQIGGENFIRGKSLNHTIVRSSPLYGRSAGGGIPSVFELILQRLERGERTELPTTELHSFAPIYGLVDLIERLVESGPRNKVLHYGGLTKISYFDFARRWAERFGYDPELIQPRKADAAHHHVSTLDYSLNSTQIAQTLKIQPLLLEEGFDLVEKRLIADFGPTRVA